MLIYGNFLSYLRSFPFLLGWQMFSAALSSLLAPITVSLSIVFHFFFFISSYMSLRATFCLYDPCCSFSRVWLDGVRNTTGMRLALPVVSLETCWACLFVCLRVKVLYVFFRYSLHVVGLFVLWSISPWIPAPYQHFRKYRGYLLLSNLLSGFLLFLLYGSSCASTGHR